MHLQSSNSINSTPLHPPRLPTRRLKPPPPKRIHNPLPPQALPVLLPPPRELRAQPPRGVESRQDQLYQVEVLGCWGGEGGEEGEDRG